MSCVSNSGRDDAPVKHHNSSELLPFKSYFKRSDVTRAIGGQVIVGDVYV